MVARRGTLLPRRLGLLFLAMAAGQLADPAGFRLILATQAFIRGLVVPNCGCFGIYLGQPLRWWVLLQDALLLLHSALLVKDAVRRGNRVLR